MEAELETIAVDVTPAYALRSPATRALVLYGAARERPDAHLDSSLRGLQP